MRLQKFDTVGLGGYTYYGLGGPYLEDFRLLYELFPDMGMVSIEIDEETYKRQEFHRPCSTLKLELEDISNFVTNYDPDGAKSVFWLDYTDLKPSNFNDFKTLLQIVEPNSMVKITLRCNPNDYYLSKKPEREIEIFRTEFSDVLADPDSAMPRKLEDFACFLQEMIQISAQQSLPAATALAFVPVSSFYYSDGTGIFTLTGIVCCTCKKSDIQRVFGDWEFANLQWGPPKLIRIPSLSVKERLYLQHLLPSGSSSGEKLRQKMGYLIDDGQTQTERALDQYAAFHRYSPYILRGVP